MSSGEPAPTATSPRSIAVLQAICFAAGVLGWIFFVLLFRGEPVQDWMVFYTAARAYLDDNLTLLFDGARFTAALNQRFAPWLDLPLGPHPWVYPPSFLVLFLPFGALPPLVSVALFVLSGFALLAAAVWLYLEGAEARRIVLLSILLCPAVPFNVMTGQNAFFTGAILVGGFMLIARA